MAPTVENLQRSRRGIEVKVNAIKSILDTFDPATTQLGTVELQLRELADLKHKLSTLMDSISDLCDDAAYTLAILNFVGTQKLLREAEVQASNLKEQMRPVPPPATHAVSKVQEVRLPRLDLPSFSGDRMQWLGFRDLFIGSVHNNTNLTGAQKLQYLKRILTDEAASMVNPFDCTNENYDKAWKLLEDRYQNMRDLGYAIIAKFINQPSVKDGDIKTLRRVVDVSKESVLRLQTLNISVADWDLILTYHLVNKLDSESRRFWQLTLKDDKIPSFDSLVEFLETRAKSLEEIPSHKPSKGVNSHHQQSLAQSTSKFNSNTVRTAHLATSSSPVSKSCHICKADHFLTQCPTFLSMSIQDRMSLCTNHSLCTNCLSSRHGLVDCTSKFNCRSCKKRHHSMLHSDENSSGGDGQSLAGYMGINNNSQVILGTAAVQLLDANGRRHTFRALIDNGSQASFISSRCANVLGLPRHHSSLAISGLSETKVATVKGSVTLQLHSKHGFTCNVHAFILKSVTVDLPTSSFPVGKWPHLHGLDLADPGYNMS